MNFKDITSHEIACKVLGREPNEATNVFDQLEDISDAINKLDENYVADFSDSNQIKWRPWFRVDASGFRFVGSGYDYSYSAADVGSRLCSYFRSQEASDFFGKQFESLHKICFYYRKTKQALPMSFKEITSHEVACKVLEKNPSGSTTTDQKITDVCNAINKLSNFKADFNNPNQRKYRPYFIMDVSGFRFGDSNCDGSHSAAAVGSRLCHYVGSDKEAVHLGVHFLELHKLHYMGE